jgi:hypothetical protein
MNGSEWPVAAAVAAIAFSFAIYYTAIAWFEHRERMAKIQKGGDLNQATQDGTLGAQSPRSSVEDDIVPLLERGLSVADIELLLKPAPGARPLSVEDDIIPLLERGLPVADIDRLLRPRGSGGNGSSEIQSQPSQAFVLGSQTPGHG